MPLTGKTALVTGAGRRVGRAIALHLAGLGAHVIVHYNKSARQADELAAEILSMGRKADTIHGDLCQSESVNAMAAELDRHEIQVDILVNCAAVYFATPIESITSETWDSILNVNLRAPFLLSQAFGLRMKKRGHGTIINISDCNVRRPYRDFLPYMISKAGINMMTETLALELAPEVRVNAIAPGTVLPPEEANEEFREQAIRRSPLKMAGTPEEIAKMAGYLATNGEFITGTVIRVDGGATIR